MNYLHIQFTQLLWRFAQDEEGQDLIEYALIAALIALVALAGFAKVSTGLSGAFTKISTDLA